MKNLGTFPCVYEIEYWDDVAEEITISRGFIYADSSMEAMATLEEYYGTPERVEIRVFSDGIPDLPEDLYNDLIVFLKERETL